jgi:TRAP transporter TAXI family solute receptor
VQLSLARWRTKVPVAFIAILVVAVGVVLASALAVGRPPRPITLRIAGGSPGSTTLPLARVIADVVRESVPRTEPSAIPTAGGVSNAELVERGDVELALVPNNAPASPHVRTIAPLHDEVLHVVVRKDLETKDVAALRGRRIGIGPHGSGTERLALAVFGHLGLEPRDLVLSNATHDDAATAFGRGELDAVFVLTGPKAPAVVRMLGRGDARLLSFGDAHSDGSTVAGIRLGVPYLSAVTIPAHAYGLEPTEAVGTVGVRLLLVASEHVPDETASRIARAIFESKARLTDAQPDLAALSERFEASELRFPLHAGAASYFRRDQPPFILAWADTFSLGITLVVLVWSAVAALAAKRRRVRKNRVDVYYSEVQDIGERIHGSVPLEELIALRARLHALRRRAFADLMAERLDANESFTIFQDYLRSELLEIEGALHEVRSAEMLKVSCDSDGAGGSWVRSHHKPCVSPSFPPPSSLPSPSLPAPRPTAWWSATAAPASPPARPRRPCPP